MRICNQCQCEMVEGFDIKVEGGAYGIRLSKGNGIFAKRLEKPRVAICPECGEVSLYIDNLDGIAEHK